jgi:hypothetical protein
VLGAHAQGVQPLQADAVDGALDQQQAVAVEHVLVGLPVVGATPRPGSSSASIGPRRGADGDRSRARARAPAEGRLRAGQQQLLRPKAKRAANQRSARARAASLGTSRQASASQAFLHDGWQRIPARAHVRVHQLVRQQEVAPDAGGAGADADAALPQLVSAAMPGARPRLVQRGIQPHLGRARDRVAAAPAPSAAGAAGLGQLLRVVRLVGAHLAVGRAPAARGGGACSQLAQQRRAEREAAQPTGILPDLRSRRLRMSEPCETFSRPSV